MKKNQTFLLSQDAIEALKNKAKATGRKKSQIVERAILRYCGEKP